MSGSRAEPWPSCRRIAIDGRNLFAPRGTGIATYAEALLTAIRACGCGTEVLVTGDGKVPSRLARYLAAFAGGAQDSVVTEPESMTRRRIAPDIFRRAQVHFDIWRRLLPVRGADLPSLMHWTAPLPLRMVGVPNIYTFHDAIPLRRPNRTGTDAVRYRRLLRSVAASADHVLTVSEATRREIVAVLPMLEGRISVIPQVVAPAPRLDPAERARVVRDCLGCEPGDYFLFCGTIEPRKNVPALIRAFRASGSARRLVLAGPDGWRAKEELAGLVGGAVMRVGYLDRAMLLCLMGGARALLYPSLEEGFGLPIIEAMGLGTPVLTSRGGATEEVAGDAALLVDPADPAGLAASIGALDGNDALCAGFSRLGLLRSAGFAPGRYAERLARLYERVTGARG